MLNAFSPSGFGWLDTSSVDGGARGILSMVPSAALPGRTGSAAGRSVPLTAGPSSSYLSAKSRDGCGVVREGGAAICSFLCIAHLSLGSTVPVACCSSRTREVQTVPLERSREGVRSVQHVISHKRADCSQPPCINEIVEQKPGTFPRQQNTVCDFTLMPLLVLQWWFLIISRPFSASLFSLFPQQEDLLVGV